jgi:hypothetical protein
MKKIVHITVFYLTLSLSLSAQEYKFPLKISINSRYLVDQKGNPFLADGKFILAYIPSGMSFKVNTDSLKGKTIKAGWYNQSDGKWEPITSYKNPQIVPLKTLTSTTGC